MRHSSPRVIIAAALAVLTLSAGSARAAEEAGQEGEVFILGALHALHEDHERFGYGVLDEIVAAINPDIIVMEVRPDELAERKQTPGRPEYPAVFWPLLETSDAIPVAMEPGGALFEALTGEGADILRARAESDPEASDFLRRFRSSLDAAMLASWAGLADSHGQSSADLAQGFRIVQFSLMGPAYEDLQERWDSHMLAEALGVVAANPESRILIVASYRNRMVFEDGLARAAPGRAVDMVRWLETFAASR